MDKISWNMNFKLVWFQNFLVFPKGPTNMNSITMKNLRKNCESHKSKEDMYPKGMGPPSLCKYVNIINNKNILIIIY